MKFTKRVLDILKKKVRWDHTNTQLCGYFTYTEVIHMTDVMGVRTPYNDYVVRWAKDAVKSGVNGSTWFHFEPTSELIPNT